MHYLYKISDILNCKVYIGQTVQPKTRWRTHNWLAKNKPKQYIHRAMAKYGIENFTYEVIATCKTQEDADFIEKLLIEQYNSRKNGYNIEDGGRVHSVSDETIGKIKAYHARPEIKEKYRNQMLGSTNKGVPGNTFAANVVHTEEWKRNHSEFMKANPNKGQFQKGTKGKCPNKGKKLIVIDGKRKYL